MRVLVTGGSGWIGQATARALEAKGYEPIAFDRHTGDDVCDEGQVKKAISNADHVIHLAGLLGTHELFDNPSGAVEVNVIGSLNVTLACATFDVPLTEITMPRVNPSLYAATKACAMDIALAYKDAGRLRCSFVRAYNAYGPGQAWGPGHPQKIVPTFATKGWVGEPLPVWGDGMLLTDLVHVDDVARMLVEATAFGDGQTFDAGSGYPQKVIDVARKVIRLTGSLSHIQHNPHRIGERRISTEADVARGEGWELLGGWRPIFDPDRFAETIESYRP